MRNVPPPDATPCELLQYARRQMYLLTSGQAVVSVDTPLLGRVEYSKGSIADLQRVIDALAADCAASGGDPGVTAGSGRRKPFSIEVWP